MGDNNRRRYKAGIYLLPNLLTTCALFFAFYSIVKAMNGFYELAATAVFISLLADTFDGRVARLTNTTSEFGAHYDSLADVVSFGLAPSLLMYSYLLQDLGKYGWLVAFMYCAATALRLARFNTQINVQDKRYFQGLPCPAAAAVLAGTVWLSSQEKLVLSHYAALGETFLMALLQVSNVRYYSFKDIDLKGRVQFFSIFVIVLLIVGIALNPALMLFTGFGIYALSGPIWTLYQLKQTRREKRTKKKKAGNKK